MEEFRRQAQGKSVLGDNELGHAKRAMNFLYSESIKIASDSGADKEKMRRVVQALLDEVNKYQVNRTTTDHASLEARANGISRRMSVFVILCFLALSGPKVVIKRRVKITKNVFKSPARFVFRTR